MKLYHATYKANLDSILELGLGAVLRKNWEISSDGGVCFADDMELAISFCEAAENVDDEIYETGIVCLEVDSGCLLEPVLFLDPNFHGEENGPTCYLYRGVISPVDLKICFEENLVDNKGVNNMIVDLILDRKDNALDGVGLDEKVKYNAHDFYLACMSYGRIADDITRAMDFGTEEDVKEALCKYIEKNEYNPVICDYIEKLDWLNKSHWVVEEAAAKAFEATCVLPVCALTIDEQKVAFGLEFDGALSFHSDAEKMEDFWELTKEEFLQSYSYLTEAEYDATTRVVAQMEKSKSLVTKLEDAVERSDACNNNGPSKEWFEKE